MNPKKNKPQIKCKSLLVIWNHSWKRICPLNLVLLTLSFTYIITSVVPLLISKGTFGAHLFFFVFDETFSLVLRSPCAHSLVIKLVYIPKLEKKKKEEKKQGLISIIQWYEIINDFWKPNFGFLSKRYFAGQVDGSAEKKVWSSMTILAGKWRSFSPPSLLRSSQHLASLCSAPTAESSLQLTSP